MSQHIERNASVHMHLKFWQLILRCSGVWLPLDSNIKDFHWENSESHTTSHCCMCYVLLLFLVEASGERVHTASDVCLPSATCCCHYRYLSWLKSTAMPLEKRQTSKWSALASILKALQRKAVSHDLVRAPWHHRSHCPAACTWSRESGCNIAQLHYIS